MTNISSPAPKAVRLYISPAGDAGNKGSRLRVSVCHLITGNNYSYAPNRETSNDNNYEVMKLNQVDRENPEVSKMENAR